MTSPTCIIQSRTLALRVSKRVLNLKSTFIGSTFVSSRQAKMCRSRKARSYMLYLHWSTSFSRQAKFACREKEVGRSFRCRFHRARIEVVRSYMLYLHWSTSFSRQANFACREKEVGRSLRCRFHRARIEVVFLFSKSKCIGREKQ